jgi:hypothetical protein
LSTSARQRVAVLAHGQGHAHHLAHRVKHWLASSVSQHRGRQDALVDDRLLEAQHAALNGRLLGHVDSSLHGFFPGFGEVLVGLTRTVGG